MEIRGKVVEYLKTAEGDEHKLAVEGLKYLRQLQRLSEGPAMGPAISHRSMARANQG
jgi:hypothetical protein